MLKGLAITPPVIGRISIGRVIERDGKRLPAKDDQFTITSQIQSPEGWLVHPLDESLRKATGGKLRSIPVRLMPCPSPDACAFAKGDCKAYARLNVVIGEEDALGSFVLRTTSYNTIRTLAARLQYFQAVSGGLLACMPLELKLRGKSTTMSFRTAIFYVDLVVRSGITLEDAIVEARRADESRRESGFDQAALDDAARTGFANGAFEDLVEDVPAVVEEFYVELGTNRPDASGSERSSGKSALATDPPAKRSQLSLAEKLRAKAAANERPASLAS